MWLLVVGDRLQGKAGGWERALCCGSRDGECGCGDYG